jgi:hypothetical protein
MFFSVFLSAKIKKSKYVGKLHTSRKQVISLHDIEQIKEKILVKKVTNIFEFENKHYIIRVLKSKNNIVLFRLETKNNKDGYYFVNLDDNKITPFNPELHKKGYGNDNINWPKAS